MSLIKRIHVKEHFAARRAMRLAAAQQASRTGAATSNEPSEIAAAVLNAPETAARARENLVVPTLPEGAFHEIRRT